MSAEQRKCKLVGCDNTLTPKNAAHCFCSPKCKAAWHRSQPLHHGVIVTAIESKTGKGGIDTIVRISFDDRKRMADIFIPGKKYILMPASDELF